MNRHVSSEAYNKRPDREWAYIRPPGHAQPVGQEENMNDILRLIQHETPTPEQIESWIGNSAYGFWTRVSEMISEKYPGVFTPEWLFGGEKHGWSLRYKKSKSFCTLIPEKNRCLVVIVFGADERAKVEMIRQELSVRTRKNYDDATTYHDGKWLLLSVDDEDTLVDVERLLTVKRRPMNVGPGKCMNEAMAYCGLICKTCPIYLVTREKNKVEQDRMRDEIVRICKEKYGLAYKREDITECDGCRTEGGRLFLACPTCFIRNCAKQKGLENCAYCREYACESLKALFATEPAARTRLDEMRDSLREHRPN